MKSIAEAESTLFWTVAFELRQAEKAGADETQIAELIDEVETVLLYTESDVIRKRCRELMARHQQQSSTARHQTI